MAATSIFPVAYGPPSAVTSDLDVQAQIYIRDHVWRGPATSLSEYAPYFRYFQWTISTVLWPDPTFEKTLFTVQTLQDLAIFVRCMDEYGDEARTELVTRLQRHFPQSSDDSILRSMDLAVRLWMTLHIRSRDTPIGPLLSDVTAVEWKPKQSLRNLVGATFPKCRKDGASQAFRGSHISPGFNVVNLRKICRIRVRWTQSLKDHLRFDHSTKTLYLYPHKICLLNHLDQSSVYPRDFVLETLRTLDLLFPYGDKSTELWLEENNQPFHRTSSSHTEARADSFAEFRYWRRQLLEVYHVFEQPPATVLQMWHDRRNPMQWYTFWLAAFIAILSIVFGSLGTYIGFKQIQLAELSIRISLGQIE